MYIKMTPIIGLLQLCELAKVIYFSLIDIDINECDGAHPCIQICNNTPGSYVCDCNPEYRLNSDGISCRGGSACNSACNV